MSSAVDELYDSLREPQFLEYKIINTDEKYQVPAATVTTNMNIMILKMICDNEWLKVLRIRTERLYIFKWHKNHQKN